MRTTYITRQSVTTEAANQWRLPLSRLLLEHHRWQSSAPTKHHRIDIHINIELFFSYSVSGTNYFMGDDVPITSNEQRSSVNWYRNDFSYIDYSLSRSQPTIKMFTLRSAFALSLRLLPLFRTFHSPSLLLFFPPYSLCLIISIPLTAGQVEIASRKWIRIGGELSISDNGVW